MSRVDLVKNRTALLAAYEDVTNQKCKTTWAVFGYEGQTNVLKVVETGVGDIDDMVEELNSGKFMYSFLRVKDPNTDLSKFVFVTWQGEGVPENKKGVYSSHTKEVQDFFKGAHVTIYARTEDDLDEDVVKDKVAKSSGSNYSFHREAAQPVEEAGPVGSVYKKVRPHVEIKSNVRDKFWEKTREEERQRQEEDKKRQQAERMRLEKERREREELESKQRDAREAERLKKIQGIKEAERKANAPSKPNKESWEETQREALRDEEERRRRGEEMRRQRTAEAASLVSSRENNPRSIFEQKPRSIFDQDDKSGAPAPRQPPPPRKLKHGFMGEQQEPQPTQRKAPIQLPKSSPVEEPPRSPPAASPPAATPPPAATRAPAAPPREPTPEPEPEPVQTAAPVSPTSPASSTSPTTTQNPASQNLLKGALPPRPPSDDEEEEEDDWGEDAAPSRPTAVITPAAVYEQPANEPEAIPASNGLQHTSSPIEEDQYHPQTTAAGEADQGQGICARALYDYQAADETEITFDPDDIITNIEMIDEGWWTGISPSGQHGMFPANYVELTS